MPVAIAGSQVAALIARIWAPGACLQLTIGVGSKCVRGWTGGDERFSAGQLLFSAMQVQEI